MPNITPKIRNRDLKLPVTTAGQKTDPDKMQQIMSKEIPLCAHQKRMNQYKQNKDNPPSMFWIRLRDILGRKPRAFAKKKKVPNRTLRILSKDQEFLHNSIRTAKYSLATFLPIFFFEQFRRYNNLFFLFIMLLQQIPNVSPTGRWTTLVPLTFIFFVSGIKELFEDYKRHNADNLVNKTLSKVYDLKKKIWVDRKWCDIRVGDIVFVEKDQFFPSDLVLLASKEPSGLCYIETSNLDGETNLKARTALQEIDEKITTDAGKSTRVLNMSKLAKHPLLHGVIECDPPNKLLYEFVGKIMYDKVSLPIGPNNILLRGAQMRNTDWAIGVVIYTGHESKLMMNSMTITPLKQSHVEIITNQQILALLGILAVMTIVSTILSFSWLKNNTSHWYIMDLGSETLNHVFTVLMNFIIIYNNLVPISLQVTLEMVRVIQAYFIDKDLQMFDEETQTFAQARTSSLNEELGQVRYILSDKTGTLTRNVMEFKMCCISGETYQESKLSELSQIVKEKGNNWKIIREFLTLLSVCHTVIPEVVKSVSSEIGEKNQTGTSQIQYSASSPDEAALVKGAQKMGFEFQGRTPQKVIINALGQTETFEILQVLEFNSDRKRMSVITKTPDGSLKLYIKGADSMIAKRLKGDQKEEYAKTEQLLAQFAIQGYRTLCCAYADLTDDYYKDWLKRYTKTLLMQNNQINDQGKNREQCLNDIMNEVESNLKLLGATGIEDKLQEGVPETIEKLMKAGIGIWMLTGDKQETATNIAYSCRLLNDTQDYESYHIINAKTPDGTRESLIAADQKLEKFSENFTTIIDSESLLHVLNSDMQAAFMDIALKSRSVICCRISPAQKAEIVQAVRKSTNSIVLAIGDGANDVAMIRAANVGIGISGREGLQAVHSSDYSIAQFRFLARLLLVHGSWSLLRVCKLTLYSFYKNIALYVIELWYASVSAWSAQTIFERWCLSAYNVFFTAWPPLAMGLFDRICSAEAVLENPELYSDQWDRFSVQQFWSWIFHGIAHSLIVFWLTYFSYSHETVWENGKADGGYLYFGTVLYTYVVLTVTLKSAMEINCWNYWTKVSMIGSMLTLFIFLNIYSQFWPFFFMGPDIINTDWMLWSSWVFWLGMFVIPPMALLFDFTQKLTQRTLYQTLVDRVMEIEAAKRVSKMGDEPSFLERTSQLVAHTIEALLGIKTFKKKNQDSVLVSVKGKTSLPDSHKEVKAVRSDAEIDIAHGFSFTQEEKNFTGLSQGNVIRMYDRKNSKSIREYTNSKN